LTTGVLSPTGRIRSWTRAVFPYVLAILVAFAVAGAFIGSMGFNVLRAYETILFTSFRTPYGFIQTLTKFVPLTLQALAFTVPLTAGKFNIGGEGQLIAGAIGASVVGILLAGLPGVLLLPLVLLGSVIAGALWAAIPGWLLYRFRISEVLTTVLMNFISFSLINYVATEMWPDPAAGHPTTVPIGKGGMLPNIIARPPLHMGFLLTILAVAFVYIYTTRSVGGYELVATGANPRAAHVYGIDVRKLSVLALVLGGALGGLSGGIEVAGVHHRLIEGLQSNYLALGILTGLIAKGNNLAVPFVAFFIAILEVGASALQRTMMIPGEMVIIVEALIVLFVLLSDVVKVGEGA